MKYHILLPRLIVLATVAVVALAGCESAPNHSYSLRRNSELPVPLAQLDSSYMSAYTINDSGCAFPHRGDEVGEAWQKMFGSLAHFLDSVGYRWQKPTQGFYRVYFNPGGAIDYFTYNIEEVRDEQTFQQLVDQWIATYRFPLTAQVQFAQCGAVTMTDRER